MAITRHGRGFFITCGNPGWSNFIAFFSYFTDCATHIVDADTECIRPRAVWSNGFADFYGLLVADVSGFGLRSNGAAIVHLARLEGKKKTRKRFFFIVWLRREPGNGGGGSIYSNTVASVLVGIYRGSLLLKFLFNREHSDWTTAVELNEIRCNLFELYHFYQLGNAGKFGKAAKLLLNY